MTSDKFQHIRESIENLKRKDTSLEYQLNQACWLGERAHLLLAEIDKLTLQLAESEAVRKSIEDNYTRLQRAIATLPESTQDDVADACYKVTNGQ